MGLTIGCEKLFIGYQRIKNESAIFWREFIKISSTASAGLAIGVALPYKERLVAAGMVKQIFEPNVWINIHPNNTIIIKAAKSNLSGKIFNVGSGKTVSVNRVVKLLGGKKYIYQKDLVSQTVLLLI